MNKNFNKFERILLISAVVTFIITVAVVIYSLAFLSNNLLHALRSDDPTVGKVVEFDIEGFKQLGL